MSKNEQNRHFGPLIGHKKGVVFWPPRSARQRASLGHFFEGHLGRISRRGPKWAIFGPFGPFWPLDPLLGHKKERFWAKRSDLII